MQWSNEKKTQKNDLENSTHKTTDLPSRTPLKGGISTLFLL